MATALFAKRAQPAGRRPVRRSPSSGSDSQAKHSEARFRSSCSSDFQARQTGVLPRRTTPGARCRSSSSGDGSDEAADVGRRSVVSGITAEAVARRRRTLALDADEVHLGDAFQVKKSRLSRQMSSACSAPAPVPAEQRKVEVAAARLTPVATAMRCADRSEVTRHTSNGARIRRRPAGGGVFHAMTL